MRRVVAFLVVGAAVIAAAWGLANLTGHVSATIGTFKVETSASIAILALAAAFVVGVVMLRVLIWIVTLPFASGHWRSRTRARVGERAAKSWGVPLARIAVPCEPARRGDPGSAHLHADSRSEKDV